MSDSDVFILSAVHTAIGSGRDTGALHPIQPVELTALVMREAVRRAGVDSACEQKKLEASLPKVVLAQGKMLDAKRAAESPASSARFVSPRPALRGLFS